MCEKRVTIRLLQCCCYRSSHRRCFIKKVFLKVLQNSRAHNFIKEETLAQLCSYKFCGIFKNTLFTEYLRAPASVANESVLVSLLLIWNTILINQFNLIQLYNLTINHNFDWVQSYFYIRAIL